MADKIAIPEYEIGKIYDLTEDVLKVIGGQSGNGIVTPEKCDVVIAISSPTGRAAGYHDEWMPDGSLRYYGQGRYGDMAMTRGNLAIFEHSKKGEPLLVFKSEGKGKGYEFTGEWICARSEIVRAPDLNKEMRDAIVFTLVRVANVQEAELAEDDDDGGSLEQLREAARNAASAGGSKNGPPRTVYERSRLIAKYVRRRAKGRCEGCASEAPFKNKKGQPYLEPHHIRRVSDGGPDDIRFVIALCPTCHSRVHHGADGNGYNAALKRKMSTIEPSKPKKS